MRIGILGAGGIAYGMAAFLEQAGHQAVLWSPSGERTVQLAAGSPLVATGAVTGSFAPVVASSCAQAVQGADVVLFALPAYGHRLAFESAAPHIREGQTVIVSSHLAFGALVLAELLAGRGVRVPIVLWGTTVLTARQVSPAAVHVGNVRKTVDMATLPVDAIEHGHALCSTLFGDRFERRDGMLAIALSNVNPQNHLAIALLNLTRMEHAEEWSQSGNTTPAVARLIEALDLERLALAKALGVQVKTVQEHISRSYDVPLASVREMTEQRLRVNPGVSGPKSLNSRYVLEDVPFGLVPLVKLARVAGVDAPLHGAGVTMLSAAYGRDFARDNDLRLARDIDRMTLDELRRLTRSGA